MSDPATLLEQCVARLDVLVNELPARRGTAFFVAPGIALTCAHTIVDNECRPAGELAFYFAGQRLATKPLEPILWPPYPDLAALVVPDVGEHPFVSLGEGLQLRPGDNAYAYGFRVDQNARLPAAESLMFTVQGRTRWWDANDDPTAGHLFIGLKGEVVAPGISGAPVLSLRTRTVCAVLKHSRNYAAAHGGLAVPIDEAVRGIPNLLTTIRTSGSDLDQGQRLFNEAEMHLRAERFAEALAAYKSASNIGHAAAQVRLGYMYERGWCGLPRDLRYARAFYKRAAQQDYPPAQFNLAVFYHRGLDDLSPDISKAATLYRAAADHEHAPALLALAQLYITGAVGGAPNDHAAVPLLRRAAAQGCAEADYQLGVFTDEWRGGLPPDSDLAQQHFKRAASAGHARAISKLK